MMKELGTSELKALRRRAGTAGHEAAFPWPVAGARTPPMLAPATVPVPTVPAVGDPAPERCEPVIHGIERRLVRRAEALWHGLAPPAGLPPVSALAALLAEPYGSQAALFRLPRPTRARPMPQPVVHQVGARLAALVETGGSIGASLIRRLGALAADAHRAGRPLVYDSEAESPGVRTGQQGPALMVRAIALPLAPPPRGAAAVVVVASWREVLSASDTRALQKELAAAISWMREQGFSGAA